MTEKELEETIKDFTKQIDKGRDKQEVIESLVTGGMSRLQATSFVDTLPTKENMRYKIGSFVWWLVVFCVVGLGAFAVIVPLDTQWVKDLVGSTVALYLVFLTFQKVKSSYRKMTGKEQ